MNQLFKNFIFIYNLIKGKGGKEVEDPTRKPVGKEILDNIFFLYKLIFRKAVGDANETSYEYYSNFCSRCLGLESENVKNRLKTIWDMLELDPTPPYMSYYTNVGEHKGAIWRSYEINERGIKLVLC